GDRYPSAAASVREGLDETLTVLTLDLSGRLRRSLATTNAIESLISRSRHVKRHVKRTLAWRSDDSSMDRSRDPRSRERLPPTEGSQRHAETDGGAARPRSTARYRRLSGERRVECQPSRR